MAERKKFHVNTLKSMVTSLTRGYLFNVYFTNVPGIDDLTGGESQTSFLVKSSSTPEATITPLEIPWQGQTYKIGATHDVGEWSCTFNVYAEAKLLKNFYAWQKAVHDPDTNVHGVPLDYLGEATVELLDVNGVATIKWHLHQLWPSSVAAVDIAQDSKDASEVAVTFQYQWHTHE